jgi:hypothetical protein
MSSNLSLYKKQRIETIVALVTTMVPRWLLEIVSPLLDEPSEAPVDAGSAVTEEAVSRPPTPISRPPDGGAVAPGVCEALVPGALAESGFACFAQP